MNVPGLLIAVAFGGAFFAIEYGLYYQPDFINPDVLISTFSTEHNKARAAVRHALINPDSAQFGTLHSVEADAARYVCGAVNARDKSGQSVNAAFVYTVAVDFARIDDNGRITLYQSGYKPCPTDDKVAQQRPAVSPGLASVAKAAQKVAPEGLTSAATVLTTPAPSAGGSSSGGTTEQQVRELAARTVPPDASTGHQPNPAATREVAKESEGHADRPPAAWPTFPPNHALAKPTRKRTPSEALKLAKDVEDRWKQAGSSADISTRPSTEDINEACRALLSIDPKDTEYPKAWAAFTRLQSMTRATAAR